MAYVCVLQCGHVVSFRKIYLQGVQNEKCPICETWQDVKSWTQDEWHSKCHDCTYSRSHGMAKVYAERGAQQHQARSRGHRTYVAFYNRVPKSEIDVDSGRAVMLPGFDGDDSSPPF